MTTAEDRRAPGYNPSFDIDLAVGAQAELMVVNLMGSLGAGSSSVEVKYDARYFDTGNVYVEYKCLKRGRWKPSGIATTSADFWAFVLGMDTFCFFISTETLKAAAREKWTDKRYLRSLDRGSHPTKGVILPVEWLTNYAVRCSL